MGKRLVQHSMLLLLTALIGSVLAEERSPVTTEPPSPGVILPLALQQTPAHVESPQTENQKQPDDTIRPDYKNLPTPENRRKREQQQYELVIKTAPPENFKLFSKPQTTIVDVFYGGRFVISTLATYTPSTIEFKNPGNILDQIPDIIGRATLLNHLTGPIASNGNKVCIQTIEKDCGSLKPQFIGVIFDESSFRADVFIHPEMISEPVEDQAAHIPGPTSDSLSLVQNFNAVYSSNKFRGDAFNLYGRTRAGKGTQHFFTDWSSTEAKDFAVERMGLQKDFQDHTLIAGLFEPRANALQAMRSLPIQGFSLATSFKRRTDYEKIIASEVTLFLASYSQVQIFKDNRLYINREYEAGHHRIDTTRLPIGAYNIEIRVTESSGATRTINKFFIKNSLLAPTDENIWFMDMGRVTKRNRSETFPDDGGAIVARGGTQFRYTKNFSVSLAGAVEDKNVLTEVGGIWVNPDVLVSGDIFATTDGAAGWSARGSTTHKKTTYSAATRYQWANQPRIPSSEYILVPDDLRYFNVNISHVLPDRSLLGATFTETRRNQSDPNRAQILRYTKPWQLSNLERLNLNAELARSNGDLRGQLSLNWIQHSRQWRHSITPGFEVSEVKGEPDSMFLSANTTWMDQNIHPDEIQVSASTNINEDQETVAVNLQDRSSRGEGQVTISHTDSQQRSSHFSSVSALTNVVAGNGHISWGGADLNQAGVILDIQGAAGALFDVYLNGKKHMTIKGDSKVALALPSYQTHRIQIRDKGIDLIRYNHNPQEFTLYPGNSVYLSWKVERVLILVGRLILEDSRCTLEEGCTTDRRPLGDVILEGTRGITTVDPDGFFQGEITENTFTLEVNREDLKCVALLPEKKVINGIVRMREVTCRTDLAREESEEASSDGPASEQNTDSANASVLPQQ